MFEPLIWWVVVELIGLAVWPLALLFFRNLPDRGYALVKPFGLLLLAYPFWLLTTYRFLENTQGGIAILALSLAIVAWVVAGRQVVSGTALEATKETEKSRRTRAMHQVKGAPDFTQQAAESHEPRGAARAQEQSTAAHPAIALADEDGHTPGASSGVSGGSFPPDLPEHVASPLQHYSPISWLRAHLPFVLATELVFAVAFFGWVLVRAYMPEITATEKPMEFAFLNGILQSRYFPPLDPWLSGYAISYYYFGYIIIAMLTMLTGVASSIAFNLAIALLFALAATGAFGLAYNLIQPHVQRQGRSSGGAMAFSLFAPILLVFAGNLEGLFEALHTRGLGTAEFWRWLDVKGLVDAPVTGSFVPTDNWWWWRASRVVHDVVRGQTQEVIDEFPQFSFLLGDMHPHVLALPFVLLVLGVALNLMRERRITSGRGQFGADILQPSRIGHYARHLLLPALIVGALPPLNFWDILPYGFIVVAAFAVSRFRDEDRWDNRAMRDVVLFGAGIGVLGLLLYLPFYIGFQSQAGGVLPVLFVKTRLHQYLIMFGLFVFVFVAFLARLIYENRAVLARTWVGNALPILVALAAFPLAVGALTLALIAVSPALQASARAALPDVEGSPVAAVMASFFGPLVADPWLFLVLVVMLVTASVLFRRYLDSSVFDSSTSFVLLILFTGLLLTFGVEFVYLRDVFGTRMNTVFKFYFQAWTLFSVGAAFAVYYLSSRLRLARGVWFIALGLLLAASMIYPAAAIPSRAEGFRKGPTLDGIEWIRQSNPSDYAAIQWLNANAPRGAVILEATGGEYSYGNRISMATGLPTVLGWFGHENQWRGNTDLFKNDAKGIDRPADIARIYQSLDSNEALTYVDKYAINFVVVGETERTQYSLNPPQIEKFGKVMPLVFQHGNLRIYARSRPS